jgi:hypothetical protein
VKNLKHINGFILNNAFLLEDSSLKNERDNDLFSDKLHFLHGMGI